jgi:hypothetical protein
MEPELVLRTISEFTQTVATNIFAGGRGNFQRSAHTKRFPKSQLKLLKKMLETDGMNMLYAVDEYITSATVDEGTVGVAVGMYLYTDE